MPEIGTGATRHPLIALLAVAGLATLAGCGDRDPSMVEVLGFPPERSAADFPGLSYPVHEGSIPKPGSLHGPVWLIAVDGATWDVLSPLMEGGDLPNFKAMVEAGAHGTLMSEEPTISPAVWATVATGMPRFEHGVINFITKLAGSYDTIEVGPPDRRSPAIWELVGASRGTSAVISWFGSYPAEEIPGYYITKRFDPENLHPRQVYPAHFAERLSKKSVVKMRRVDLQLIGWNDPLQRALLHDARTLAALRVIDEGAQPDLVAVYFAGIDIVQHTMWRHMDPSTQQFPEDGEPDADLARVIPSYYRFIDHTLGEIVAMAPEDTTFVVVSDHGGGPLQLEDAYHLQLEVLLTLMGLMDDNHRGPAYALSELYRHEKRIWLNLAGIEPDGTVPLDRADARAQSIRERLLGLVTDTGDPVFTTLTVHTAEPRWRPGDPALTVRFSRAALLAASVQDEGRTLDFSPVRMRLTDVSGSHRPDGILILNGPGIRPGALGKPSNIYQVAPTLLYLLGLPQDGRMLRRAPRDGGVMVAALDPGLLARHPVTMIPEYPGTNRGHLLRAGQGPVPDEIDPARDEAMERLRALGYIR